MRWARTRRRTAPPTAARCPSGVSSSRSITKAALLSRASRVRRTATPCGSAPLPSRITNPKAPLRRRTSAHQGPCATSGGGVARLAGGGRTIQRRSVVARVAQSAGASVRAVSMYATHRLSSSAWATISRTSVVLPLPRLPTISVSRPSGSPPSDSTASSAAIPVGSPVGMPLPGRGGGAMTAASCWRRVARDVMDEKTRRRSLTSKRDRTKTEYRGDGRLAPRCGAASALVRSIVEGRAARVEVRACRGC